MPPSSDKGVDRGNATNKQGVDRLISGLLLESRTAFCVCFFSCFLAAIYSPIQDCDEIFNFWEPTHYLNYGYGLQTWEFSPDYAIRSWLYISLHALPISPFSWLPLAFRKTVQFYLLRIALAAVCAGCEARLFNALSRAMNPRIALYFLIAIASSTGMVHASASYLPSSFAMYTTMLASVAFINGRRGPKTHEGLMWLGIGSILGWPFVAAVALPFILEELVTAVLTEEYNPMMSRLVNGFMRSSIVLALEVAVDTFFYKKLTCVPLNIVWYNIFSGSSKGPSIYGTEPWHFYFRNLFLNFNLWFMLALLALPLLIYQSRYLGLPSSRLTFFRSLIFISPFYLWITIFTLQPHKEERFMYPVYPCLAINAALSLHIITLNMSSPKASILTRRMPALVRSVSTPLLVVVVVSLSIWRTVGLITAYSAPLKIYTKLQDPGLTNPASTVCLGKEWYRFPSSYHLPNGAHAKFVKSEFSGLLPGEFSEATVGFGLFPGAWLIPSGMNDENKEDVGKYTRLEHCAFMVDSYFPGSMPSALEPAYMLDTEHWEKLACEPFLDAARTGTIGRLFWLPNVAMIPEKYRRRWGEYCLLRRKR